MQLLKIIKILELLQRIRKITKILKSHIRIIKQNENIRIDNVNQENRANLRILL